MKSNTEYKRDERDRETPEQRDARLAAKRKRNAELRAIERQSTVVPDRATTVTIPRSVTMTIPQWQKVLRAGEGRGYSAGLRAIVDAFGKGKK